MMPVFGQHFVDDLQRSGLYGAPIAWNAESGEIWGRDRLSAEQNAILDAVVAAHAPNMISPIDVKAEAQRRIIARTGTKSLDACLIKQLNATMRAIELNDKRLRGEILSPEEEVEATTLRDLATSIKTIRAKSNAIEAMSPIPADYASDGYWA